MARVRNEEATCGTCVYRNGNTCVRREPINVVVVAAPRGFRKRPIVLGTFRAWPDVVPDEWCGEHPDFWTEAPTD